METLLLSVLMLQYVTKVIVAQGSCPVTQYRGGFKADDYKANHALLGHYKNITTLSANGCFSACVMDCRCVSYQMSGTQCELNDEDKQTAPSQFTAKPGYTYYKLNQRFVTKNTISGCGGHCRNGCCTFTPCKNGGTCIEQCDDVKRKFACICPSGFTGKICEKLMTCAAYGPGLVSGLYPITLPSGQELKVYCDFQSQPGTVWTLIESFALAEKLGYMNKPFTVNFPVNEASLNWANYRLSRAAMLHLRSNATLWRATCKYDTDGLVTTDYIRGSLTRLDIIMTITPPGGTCAHVQYINVRSIHCTECTAHFAQLNSLHPTVDSGYGSFVGCQWDGRLGAVTVISNGLKYTDQNFGFYMIVNPAHRCSSSPTSTTQWWLGV